MHAVVLPVLGANMTHGIVRAWYKEEGDPVEPGEPLFEVETDKVNADVEAEVGGVLRKIVAPLGARIPVLGIVAFVGAAEEPMPPPETWSGEASEVVAQSAEVVPLPVPVAQAVRTRAAASPAARRLARELGVSLEGLRGTGARGEITRADVEAAATASASSAGDGVLDPAFVDLLRRDAESFRRLSSEMKLDLYRRHGAVVGEGVRIEEGAIIVASEMRIGAASIIGAYSSIFCDRLHLGRLVAFGKRTRVRCRTLVIGDALWSKDDVVIGGGGSSEPGARLEAGDACFFGEGAYLNTGHPLTLGDEVCIGSRAMLFTHSHWQSILRGYPSVFGPIDVADHVFVGNNAFVFPGVTLGAGCTVMVNSFVALDVPPRTLVGGVPAQVVRHITAPSHEQQVELMRERLPDLVTALRQHGHAVREGRRDEVITLDLEGRGCVALSPSWSMGATAVPEGRSIVMTFLEGEPELPPGTTLFDLQNGRVLGPQDRISDEVREFCRRLGIRFRPFAWRYGVGHFEGDRFVPRPT